MTGVRRTALAFLLMAALALCAGAAAQENEMPWGFELWDRLTDAQTAGLPAGTPRALYAAPFEDAWRGEGGQAVLRTDEPFYVLGAAEDWRMVCAAEPDGFGRVGWALMPEVPTEGYDNFYGGGRLLRLTRDAALTDDPWGGGGTAVRLKEGDTVIGLKLLESGLIYAETEIDGKTAWLFMDADAAEEVPLYRIEDGTLYISEGVTWLGGEAMVWDEGPDGEDLVMEPGLSLQKGMVRLDGAELVRYPETDFDETDPDGGDTEDWQDPVIIRRVVFPASLRVMGTEALCFGSLEELRLPEGLVLMSDSSFYAVDFGQVTFPAGFSAWNRNCFDRCTVKSYRAEPGNPLFSSRDGVLFSADGSVLVRYPDGSPALHYDVPAGVREIADHAFDSDLMAIPLKTVSLPMGLERIGRYAFSGCGRLQSLTVPLTVTDLSPAAFRYCVSLERLSLPPGLSVQPDEDWSLGGDFTFFNGDNGTTWTDPSQSDVW